MIATRVDEYHKYGCHFYGRLVVVEWLDDAKNDKRWGGFGADLTGKYTEQAKKLVREKYGEPVRELLHVPEYVVEVK